MNTKQLIKLDLNCTISNIIKHDININLLVIENNNITIFYTSTPSAPNKPIAPNQTYYPHLEEYTLDELEEIKNDFNDYIYYKLYNIIILSNRKEKIEKLKQNIKKQRITA